MRKQKIFLVLLVVAIFGIMGTTAVEAKTVILTTNQETGFWVWSGETVEVYYSPNQQGNKMFSTWHKSLYHLLCADNPTCGLTKVSFYWKDNSNPGDPWHSWRSADVGLYPFKTTQNLYSGSSSIRYKFVYQTYSDGIYVYAKVQ